MPVDAIRDRVSVIPNVDAPPAAKITPLSLSKKSKILFVILNVNMDVAITPNPYPIALA